MESPAMPTLFATAADLWNDVPFSLSVIRDDGHLKQAFKMHYFLCWFGQQ